MSLSITISTALCVIILVLIKILLKRWQFREILSKYPCPPTTLPVIGNALDFKTNKHLIPVMLENAKNIGKKVIYWFGPNHFNIVTTDVKLINALLSDNFNLDKPPEYNHYKTWLGEGLLTAKADKWKKHRKVIISAFSAESLKKYVKKFKDPTSTLIEKLAESEEAVDAASKVDLYAFDIICETLLDKRMNFQKGENSDLPEAMVTLGQIILLRSFSWIKGIDILFRFTRDYYKQKKAVKILNSYATEMLEEKKTLFERNGSVSKSSGKGGSFWDSMLLSRMDGKLISDEEIKDEIKTFLFAGHDTVATAMSFTLYCLAKHPDIQEKAFREQIDLFGSEKDPDIQIPELTSMTYLEMVLEESMRYFPPVAIYGRRLTEDMKVDDEIIPKQMTCFIFAYGVNYDPSVFENPEVFDPTRFAARCKGGSFAPFSGGIRSCIGQKFACLEMKYMLSAILRHFEVRLAYPDQKLEITLKTTLATDDEIMLKFHRRHNID